MRKDNRYYWKRPDLLIVIGVACVLTVVCALLSEYAKTPPLFTALAGLFLCLFSGVAVSMIWNRVQPAHSTSVPSGEINQQIRIAASQMHVPALMCDQSGLILWCNETFHEAVGKVIRTGDSLDAMISLSPTSWANGVHVEQSVIGGRIYSCKAVPHVSEGEQYWFLTFTDETELELIRKRYSDERVAVAYIVVDNIEELLQYIQEKFRNATNQVEQILRRWAEGMNGVLRSYDNNKYILFFDAAFLEKCLEDRFSILDEIREVRVGDGMPITVSVGVSCIDGTLSQREQAAQAALDMALQRGGDQVVYKKEEKTEFYGGKTKAVYRRTNVRARVMGNRLCGLLGTARNVLIMGHRYGDFDSFGASVGMVRLAKVCGVEAHIVANRSDSNLLECFDRMEALEDYEDVFISATDAMDHLHSDTLVVLVDVNNYEHAESPAILRAAQKNIVIIDHHNQRAEFPSPPLLAYIEPSASSASELVGEILEQHMTSSGRILKEEAEMMLSGILLDTKRFSRSTGTRTFSVALYLRGEGANPGEANELFKTEVGDLIKEARFNSHVVIYRDQIALSVCDGEADSSYRVVAAKAADKLLGVRGVHASFAMVKIGEKIHISARSDGSINVQVILEQLHGGGHFDVAGAQVEGDSVQAVISKLKEAIDKFVD